MTDRVKITLGMGSCCQAGGAAAVFDRLNVLIEKHSLDVEFSRSGCVGMCHRTPLMQVTDSSGNCYTYQQVDAPSAEAILRRHVNFGSPVTKFLHKLTSDTAWINPEDYLVDMQSQPVENFLSPQVHIATENYGTLDPLDLDQYISVGGYKALEIARQMTSEQVVEVLKTSGLRGRGGAGFPTWRKWQIVSQQDSPTKYVVCNGDEGDPGAFMDRMLLESYPHRIIEGTLIAAHCAAAAEIIFYIRLEYPLAMRNIQAAIDQATAAGLTGGVKITLARGAGAFVCGEESALLESISGRRGRPRQRPPFPAVSGLFDKPTLVSNVETYSCVPWIFRNGGEAFSAIGSKSSSGTKVFALAGKVLRGGLIEAPMGLTIRQMVSVIGGGVKNGRSFKAVQIGGPSGGCIPQSLADTPIDYERLTEIGAMMGSGGLVVLDDSDCMVDIAAYFLSFTRDESCGQCTPCRVGSTRMLEILDRIRTGGGKLEDLDELENIASYMKSSSLCGLGKTAPNPVLSTLKYFRDEYIAHIEGRCPAGVCEKLITVTINDNCIGCTRCSQVCPNDAIIGKSYHRHVIDPEKCVRCKMCQPVCPVEAIEYQ